MKTIIENPKFIPIKLGVELEYKLFKLTESRKFFYKDQSAKIASEFNRFIVNKINQDNLYNLGDEVFFYLTYNESKIGELTFFTDYNAESKYLIFSVKDISFHNLSSKSWSVQEVQYISLNYNQILDRSRYWNKKSKEKANN